MNKRFFDLGIILLIIFLALFTLKDLRGPKFYTSHDGQEHLARLYQFDHVLRDGQIPPRWSGQLNGERGYPIFIFVYPLPYYVGEILHLMGFNLAESVKLTFVIFYLLSGIVMYFFAKEIFKDRLAAFLSSILWIWVPYQFVKIFVTASLGESVGFAFIPLLFLFTYKLSKKQKLLNLLGLVIALTGIILSHLIVLIIFLPLWLLFLFWSINQLKEKEKALKFLFLSLFLALAIGTFYLFPAILERKYTRYQEVISYQYYQQFTSIKKLLYSPWGYGAPKFGPGELSLQVGIAQWLAVAISSTIFLIFFFKKGKNIFLPLIFLFNFCLSIFLMLEISKPAWDLIGPLQNVNTPWRFLSLSIFTSAILGGWSLNFLKKKNFKGIIFIFLLLLFLVFYGNRNHLRINQTLDYPDKYFETYYWVANAWDEYRPKWLENTYYKPPKKLIEIIKGNCQVSNQIKRSNLISFNLACDRNSEILVQAAYYPGWSLWIDKKDQTINSVNNLKAAKGLFLFNVTEGNHKIELIFRETRLRLIADFISLFGGLLFLFLIVKTIFYNKK